MRTGKCGDMADNQDDSFSASKAEVFEALGHPTRIRLLQTLSDKPLPFSELKRAAGLESNGLLTFHLGKLSGLVRLNPEGAYALTDEGREALRIVEASKNQSQERPFQGPSIHVPHPKTVLAVFVVVLVILASASAMEYNQIQGLDSRIQTTQSATTGTTTVTTGIPTTVTTIITTAVTTTIAATSLPEADGQSAVTCTKYPGNPVLVSGSGDAWDNSGVAYPSVILNGSDFVMFYSAIHNNVTEAIGLATSTDGVNWTKYPSPILQPGVKGTWDSSWVDYPSVIWNGTEYLMYYSGFNSTSTESVGVAFSKDMIHWQKYVGNPILRPGPGLYDNYSISSHAVMYDPPLYKMWYAGRYSGNYTHSIGYATSPDGVHWTKYTGNPVMTRMTTDYLYFDGPFGPSVVKISNNEYFAAFETDGLVSSATSPDGIHWTASTRPMLLNSNQTSGFDYVIEKPSILLMNSTVYLWYTGFSVVGSEPVTIGFAFCSLSPLVLTTTITSTSLTTTSFTTTQTSVSTTTVVSRSTAIQTSTTTKEVPTAALTLYQVSTAVLAILLLIAAATIFARRRSR
jgi:predicted GH43/DUF377 family glycosyl hydrolase/DNA-binding transcriptional ArsR family regulator